MSTKLQSISHPKNSMKNVRSNAIKRSNANKAISQLVNFDLKEQNNLAVHNLSYRVNRWQCIFLWCLLWSQIQRACSVFFVTFVFPSAINSYIKTPKQNPPHIFNLIRYPCQCTQAPRDFFKVIIEITCFWMPKDTVLYRSFVCKIKIHSWNYQKGYSWTNGKSRLRTGYIQKALLRLFLSVPYPTAKL